MRPPPVARVSRGRLVLGALGSLVGAYGALLVLTGLSPSTWLKIALWMGGAIAVHDAVLVPVVLALAWAGRRVLPRSTWGPVALGLVVTGALTAVAAVVLLRGGEDAGISSLLDRDYVTGYALSVGSVWAAVAVLLAVQLLRPRWRGPLVSAP